MSVNWQRELAARTDAVQAVLRLQESTFRGMDAAFRVPDADLQKTCLDQATDLLRALYAAALLLAFDRSEFRSDLLRASKWLGAFGGREPYLAEQVAEEDFERLQTLASEVSVACMLWLEGKEYDKHRPELRLHLIAGDPPEPADPPPGRP